jgi:hypothetical protein
VLAISSQHVAELAVVNYVLLRTFVVLAATRILTTLALIRLYNLVAGASVGDPGWGRRHARTRYGAPRSPGCARPLYELTTP